MRRQRCREDHRIDRRIRNDTVVSVGRRNIRESVVDFHAMVGMDIADGSHQAVGASKKFWQQLFAPIAGADQGHGNFLCHDPYLYSLMRNSG